MCRCAHVQPVRTCPYNSYRSVPSVHHSVRHSNYWVSNFPTYSIVPVNALILSSRVLPYCITNIPAASYDLWKARPKSGGIPKSSAERDKSPEESRRAPLSATAAPGLPTLAQDCLPWLRVAYFGSGLPTLAPGLPTAAPGCPRFLYDRWNVRESVVGTGRHERKI